MVVTRPETDLDVTLTQVESLVAKESQAVDSVETAPSIPAPVERRPGMLRKLSVLVPVYNERWTVEEIVERILGSPVSLELEIIAVDDCSTDGSWEVLQDLTRRVPALQVVRHAKNRGKGAAIRTAIEHVRGDVAVIQDADLEYDPQEYARLLAPILAGEADAVYGSRYAGDTRRVLAFWHSLMNYGLTLLSNMLNDLNLTDMETCYKVVRTDVLSQLRLQSNTFTIEPELTCRLAQWGARIYEVPVSYRGRTVHEGKKIHPVDGLKALWEMVRCRFLDPQFTTRRGLYEMKCLSWAHRHRRWLLQQCQPFLGRRVLDAGAGIGNLSARLLDRDWLVLVDRDDTCLRQLRQRFDRRRNVRTVLADLTDPESGRLWKDDRLDTVVCANVLEYIEPDVQVLELFRQSLSPGGHCLVITSANPRRFNGLDQAMGRRRRYAADRLRQKMEKAGFQVVHAHQACRLGGLAWWLYGNVLRRRHLTPTSMIWFDRIWPMVRHLDSVLPLPGSSLLMVGRRPQ
jgi:glycosyltransferase involved in cell wall biosynthesis